MPRGMELFRRASVRGGRWPHVRWLARPSRPSLRDARHTHDTRHCSTLAFSPLEPTLDLPCSRTLAVPVETFPKTIDDAVKPNQIRRLSKPKANSQAPDKIQATVLFSSLLSLVACAHVSFSTVHLFALDDVTARRLIEAKRLGTPSTAITSSSLPMSATMSPASLDRARGSGPRRQPRQPRDLRSVNSPPLRLSSPGSRHRVVSTHRSRSEPRTCTIKQIVKR